MIEILIFDDESIGIRSLDPLAELVPGGQTVSTPGKCEMSMAFSYILPVERVYYYDVTEREDEIKGMGLYEQRGSSPCTQAFEVEGVRLVGSP